ncbi:dihydrodipicolinate synthase family protein [Paenibacillus azoreducens]|uniref:dihydrodipicolinate synthase family protein n=1 Tax=Paenibacillus azoreducens TaxID=116718 RepID=UPI0039F59827
MLTSQSLNGVFVPVVTPFDKNRNLDMRSFDELTRRLVGKGIHGLIVNGTIGETPLMDSGELEALIMTARQAIDATRAIPLIVGTGSNKTSSTVKRTAQAKALGADAALVVTPLDSYSEKGIIQHFRALAEAELPIVLCDLPHPGRGSLDLGTIRSIMEMDHVIGLRESTGNLSHVFKLSRSMSKPVLCGEDELFFASLCCGAQGGILAGANLDSDQFVQVYELFQAGSIEASHQAFDQLLPLIEFLLSEPNPAPLKWLLAQRRHIRSDRLRLPISELNHLAARNDGHLMTANETLLMV